MMRSARWPSADQLLGKRHAEEINARRNAFVDRDLGDICRWLDAKHRHSEREKMLQKISVIAGELDGKTCGAQTESSSHHLAIGLGVGDPGGRV